MKRVFLALALVVCLPMAAVAQSTPIPGCGSNLHYSNVSGQLGGGLWLHYIVETSVDLNLCVFGVGANASVAGLPGASLSRSGILSASAARQVPVTGPGVWTIHGSHWAATVIPFLLFTANSMSQAVVTLPDFDPPPMECDGEIDPETGKCGWVNCPIIVSMNRDGYDLTSARTGVPFDLNGDGVLERVAWTRRDGDEAFLAYDRNGNGRIDDGTELFGNHTPVRPGDSRATAPNGFEALRFAQQGQSPGAFDDVLDARDPIWSKLLLWTDRNHNGMSERDELVRLPDSGIVSIGLDYKTTKRVDRFGNEFRQRAEIGWSDGYTGKVFDVWLTRVR